jgi:putative tryptophan/tyrosine transport system substrate-binding protein
LGVSIDVAQVATLSEVGAAFEAIGRKRPEAALVIADPFLAHQRALLATHLLQHRLPSISAYRECAVAGRLLANVTSYYEATFVHAILRGAKPGDLPIEHPTKFEFVINLKTAKALRLEVPPSLLVRANRLIE